MLTDIELGERLADRAYHLAQKANWNYVEAVIRGDKIGMTLQAMKCKVYYKDYQAIQLWLEAKRLCAELEAGGYQATTIGYDSVRSCWIRWG